MKGKFENKTARPRFVCLTNIPTPYRLHFFQNLSRQLAARGWQLEVWFMASSERGRHWHFEPEAFEFHYRFFWGISFVIGGTPVHFNPGIPRFLLREAPDALLVAGGWGLPTNILVTLMPRPIRNCSLVFWSESHLRSTRLRNSFVNKLRRVLLSRYDAFAVPGQMALDYVKEYAPNKPVYSLPNTVNEVIFRDRVLRYRGAKHRARVELGLPNQGRILLLAARLAPEKGILEFLSAVSSLPSSVTSRVTLLIAGDGRLKDRISLWISANPRADVRLLGHVTEDEMANLYGVADSFVLPSLLDPNPLSVIEALWAGLPLILSERVGNNCEALRPGENGWSFDPESASGAKETLEEWAATSTKELELFGRASARIAEERFTTETVVKNFLDQVLD